ncbi:unnamed protein product [Cylicocyclus nassatus]|uniref:Uncharacterized protein n=1 Tax=Cylicocyclus nassatus TaxID=53992 RepID=A0AA36M2L9_CYLNA|nr:unnamed protein product [Cylicocyclus nassatus]
MKWALIVLLLLFNLVQPIQPSTNPRTVDDPVYWSLCEGMDSKDPLVRKLAKKGCNSLCKKKGWYYGACRTVGVCTCI